MARKLKTYITNLGFFELALAAPSMKAALEAWGMGHNAFHQGFAKETDDPKIVAAAMAKPGVVLRRPVGTRGAFTEKAALPKQLWDVKPPKAEKAKAKAPAKTKAPTKAKAKPKATKEDKADRAAILSFEKAKVRRDREREKEEAREEAKQTRERVQRQRDGEKAEAALARAQAHHDEAMAALEKERDRLDRRAALENERWDAEREELKVDLRKAKR